MDNFGESSVRRPRGRPLGSKNKPKGNPSPTQTKNKVVLLVPHGFNIIQWVQSYAQQNQVSLAILTGYGSVSDVALQHKASQLPLQELKEDLELISFSGACVLSPSGAGSFISFFNASLRRGDGSAVSGSALHMVANGPVSLSAFILSDPEFYKVPTVA